MYYYYAIIERSNNFCVLETGYDELNKAWQKANKLYAEYPEYLKDFDVLAFDTEIERIQYLTEITRR